MDGNNGLENDLSTVMNYADDEDQLLYDLIYNLEKIYIDIEKFSILVILPIIGIVGLVGNALNGVIMVKDGLHKPSNILLLGLAMADFLFLIQTIDISYLLKYASPLKHFWVMDLNLIFLCYYLYKITLFLFVVGFEASVAVTMFITLERVIAIYFPLKYSRWVTPKRGTFAVILSFLLTLPAAVSQVYRYTLFLIYDERIGGWAGAPYETSIWRGSWMQTFTFIRSYIVPVVPTIIVSIGCVLLGVKIAILMRRRKKLTTSTKTSNSSSRTRTLCLVSFVFIVTHTSSLFMFLPQLRIISNRIDLTYYLANLYCHTVEFLLLLNSSCNVFIYVVFNPKFRKLLKQQLFCFVKVKKNK